MHNWNYKFVFAKFRTLHSAIIFIHNIMKDFLLLLGNYLRGNGRNCLKFKARYILFTFNQILPKIYSNIMKYGKRLCEMSQETKIPTPCCKTPWATIAHYFLVLQETVQLRKDKYLCCCCCKSGPLTCALRLDRTGYVPGEDINLDAEIQKHEQKRYHCIVCYHATGTTFMSTLRACVCVVFACMRACVSGMSEGDKGT